jgi:hypothetical protein
MLLRQHHVEGVLSVDEDRLDRDLFYRFHFLAQFVDFSLDEIKIIQENIDFVQTILPKLTHRLHEKFLSFDAIRKLLLGRMASNVLQDLVTDPDTITIDSENIQHRRLMVEKVFLNLLRSNWDEEYLNGILAKQFSFRWGNPLIDIPLVFNSAGNMACQLLFVEFCINSDLPQDVKNRLAIALNKALSIFVELSNASLLLPIEVPQPKPVIDVTPTTPTTSTTVTYTL